MTEDQFDRLARILAGSRSRRQALAALGALAAARLQSAHAAQIAVAACGESGAVCTPLQGCCDGLVCATSHMNPAYGVCVTGEGDMLPVSDDLVVPGSEGIEDELVAQVTDAEADATAAQSVLDDRQSDIQARKDAKRARKSARRTRLQTNKDAQQLRVETNRTRKATNRSTRAANRDARKAQQALNEEPNLTLEFHPGATGAEILRVHNRDNTSVVVSRIESIQQPKEFKTPGVSISTDDTHLFESESTTSSTAGVTVWSTKSVCPGDPTAALPAGISLTVAQSGATQKHVLLVLCGETVTTGSTVTAASQSGRQPRKNKPKKRGPRGKGR